MGGQKSRPNGRLTVWCTGMLGSVATGVGIAHELAVWAVGGGKLRFMAALEFPRFGIEMVM